MNKAFEKILEILKEVPTEYRNEEYNNAIHDVIKYINRFAEEYNNGWIPCSERLPEEYGDYLVWWTDITRKQYYEIVEYEPNNGWIGEIPQAVEGIYSVIAWQPLPEPFKERD